MITYIYAYFSDIITTHGPNTGVGVCENMFLQMAFMYHSCLSRKVSVFQKWQNPCSLPKFLSRTEATKATEEIKKIERLLHQRGSKVAHRILGQWLIQKSPRTHVFTGKWVSNIRHTLQFYSKGWVERKLLLQILLLLHVKRFSLATVMI